jgi:hypothetical protein
MIRTEKMSDQPAYTDRNRTMNRLRSFGFRTRVYPTVDWSWAGLERQVGGEFLFEPPGMPTPDGVLQVNGKSMELETGAEDEKRAVTWCNRMKTKRDHAEIPEIMDILGLDGDGVPNKKSSLQAKAVSKRKGNGKTLGEAYRQRRREQAQPQLV